MLLATTVAWVVYPKAVPISRAQFRDHWKGIVAQYVLTIIVVVCNLYSLVHMGLSLNQIIKCTGPLPTAAFAYCIERKLMSRRTGQIESWVRNRSGDLQKRFLQGFSRLGGPEQ